MGFFRFVFKSLIFGAVIVGLISFIPGLPPHHEFTEFKVSEPMLLEGRLSINILLNNAEHLYSSKLHGPEAFADHKGVLYTGIHGGEIVKLVSDKVVHVAKLGKSCDGYWNEKTCGRPLGLKFGSDGYLYVADGYYGIFKVNVDSGEKTELVSIDESINGKVCKLPNSVDVATDGSVYWSCSSTNYFLHDGVFDGFADGSGRLLKYDPRTKRNEVLIDGLHFANGVILSVEEDFVLVAETMRSRVHRYYLKGSKKGSTDIFIDNLPGLPDNLKSDGQGGFFIPLVVLRDKYNPVLFQTLGPFPQIRKFLARALTLLEMSFQEIDRLYPNYYSQRAIHWIGHFESVNSILRKGTTVIQVDKDGNIKHSFHNTDGTLSGISDVHWFNDAFYFGSPYNTYIGRVKLSFAKSDQKESAPNLESKQKPKIEEQRSESVESQRTSQLPKKRSPSEETQKSPPPQQQSHKHSPSPSPPSQQPQKPSPQPQKPSPPPLQPQKPSHPPQQPQKPSPPPKQPEIPSPPSQQPQKQPPPPQQAQKPSPPQKAQKHSPPPQQAQKPSPPPQQAQKQSASPQQIQKPSPTPQQAQKPSPPPQQARKQSAPPQQAQKPSPPPQQAQKPSSPLQQAQKPSSPSQQAQKPSSPTQQPEKPSPPTQQPEKPSPPPQQAQKQSPPPQQAQKQSPPPQPSSQKP